MNHINLPEVIDNKSKYLVDITTALGVQRDVIACDEDIKEAWERLPRVLSKIPIELRTKGVVKMCIAVSSGLFDSGINYIWNESIVELRNKIIRFGLSTVGKIINKIEFDEIKLNDLKDSELLNLCLNLNLITEEGFFYLDQCRDIRNNFSVAHPTIGDIDEAELISFTNRCVKYALSNETNLVGINISDFIDSLKLSKFNNEQLELWCERLEKTYEAQRELLFGTLYGIYCDSESSEESRVNAINVFKKLKQILSPTIKSNLIESHENYRAKGIESSITASQQFFEKLSLLELLGDSEQHALIKKACDNLLDAHLGMNNFYNEPPFAERLQEITKDIAVPISMKYNFVETVLICGIGNGFGVSNKAFPFYQKMISNFSPKEISLIFEIIEDSNSDLSKRLTYGGNRKGFLKQLLLLIDISSVPVKSKSLYEKWIR